MKVFATLFIGSSLFLTNTYASIEVATELVSASEKKEAGADGGADGKKAGPPAAAPAAGAAAKPVNQEKALKITVRNASNKPEGGLLVRYWIIGRDMKTMKPSLMDGGEASTELKPSATTVITSEPVKASYTQRQVYVAVAAAGGAGAKGGAPKGGASAKPAEAGGTKIVGYGAQVINKDGKVISEFFSEAAYKQIVGSEGNKPGPLFKAPKPEEAK